MALAVSNDTCVRNRIIYVWSKSHVSAEIGFVMSIKHNLVAIELRSDLHVRESALENKSIAAVFAFCDHDWSVRLPQSECWERSVR